jgi:class 3 adenylate cyclase
VRQRFERRLTTIPAADVAGYSRLMRADKDATLALLTRCRDFTAARIAEHRAATLGQLGRTAEAKDALEKAISIGPSAVDSYARGYVGEHYPWLRPEDHAHLLEGLRKAGWHE